MTYTHKLTAEENGDSITPPEGYEFDLDENGEKKLDENQQPIFKKTEVAPPPPPKVEVKKEEPDYKRKFGDSTRRNQIVESQFSELQKILGDITKQEVPSDEEMGRLVPDFEFLSDREKNVERKVVVLERRQNLMMNTFSNISTETENLKKLENFINNEPKLKGKEDDFIAFVDKPANKGASMEVLLNAFLFEVKPEIEPVVEPEVVPEIAPSFERGTGHGGQPIIKTGKKEWSDEELANLRKNDSKKYNELIRTGQI